MPSEHPFDSKLKQQFEQFQPEVDGDWNAIERRLNDGSAGANRHHAPSLNRWAVATAVAAGGALMWVAKPVFEDMLENHAPTQVEIGLDESAPTFDEVWDEFVSVNAELGNAIVSDDADAVGALTTSDEQETVVLDRVVVDDVAFDAEQVVSEDAVAPTQTREGKVDAPTEEDEMDTKHVSLPVSSWTEERILAELPFDASIRKACEGVEVSFELTGIDRRMNFLWNFGDGHFSSDPAPSHQFNSPGTYDITLSVRPPGDGSIRTRTIQNMITVLPKPEANFAWAFPATSNGDEVEVQLKNQTQAAVQSFWTLNGESTSAGSLELKVPGVYAVSLEANNEHGCVDDIEKEIHVGNLNGLLAQSRFSPNGDGRYDTFMPHGLKDMDGTWELVIADIAGQEVYRTSNASMPWDGVLPNGSLAASRSEFIWTARCVDAQGETRLFTDRLLVEL